MSDASMPADQVTPELDMHTFACNSMREGVATPPDCEGASELFRALANPVRVAIVALLADRSEQCVHDLVESLELPQPLVSQHLRVLRNGNLVTGTRRGREVVYSLPDEHVAHIVADALTHTLEEHTHDTQAGRDS